MKVDRRFRNGLLIMNSYTLGRGEGLREREHQHRTPIDFELSWARSNFDRTHNYVLTTIYELPWGPGKRWMNEGLLGKIVGGWQLSGLFIAQSGSPLNITGNGTLLNTPGNTAYAEPERRAATCSAASGPASCISTRPCTRMPAAGVQGNMTRNGGPEGPGFWAARHVAVQAVRVRRRARFAEFRVDAFNVDELGRAGATRTPASAQRPATRSARSPAPTAASAACGSAGGSCSDRLRAQGSGLRWAQGPEPILSPLSPKP